MIAETERLLSGRKRDLKLTGRMLDLYRSHSWRQRSAIVRSWMIWVTAVGLVITVLNLLLVPQVFWVGALVCGVFVPALNAILHAVWRKPRSAAVEGLSIVVWTGAVLSALAGLGALAGGAAMERYLAGTLFVCSLAIIVLGADLAWAAVTAVLTVTLVLVFNFSNPALTYAQALALTSGYALGFYTTFVARRTLTIVGQHSFLLSLRDRHQKAELAILATIDSLTGLLNRRSAGEAIARLWSDPAIDPSRIAFLMVDIDLFKRLNDSCGHAAGDDCIRNVASIIAGSVRARIDIVARHGGEEFLVVLVAVDVDAAAGIADHIRETVVRRLTDPIAGTPVTVSVGVAMATPGIESETAVQWADTALYAAKRRGRNRVCVFPQSSLPAVQGTLELSLPSIPSGRGAGMRRSGPA